jgi:hypothetical protein
VLITEFRLSEIESHVQTKGLIFFRNKYTFVFSEYLDSSADQYHEHNDSYTIRNKCRSIVILYLTLLISWLCFFRSASVPMACEHLTTVKIPILITMDMNEFEVFSRILSSNDIQTLDSPQTNELVWNRYRLLTFLSTCSHVKYSLDDVENIDETQSYFRLQRV